VQSVHAIDDNPTLPCCRFEIAIFVLIFLNMLTMGIEHYNQPHAVFFVLEVSNAFFTTVFGLGKSEFTWIGDPEMQSPTHHRRVDRDQWQV
jgi:hypothetical protein